MTNIRKMSRNSYNFFIYFINGLKIKECSSKLAMGHLHHAVTLLVVDLKRLQPIRLTINRRQHTNILANVNLLEITGGHANKIIVVFPSFCLTITTMIKRPMI